MVKGILGTVTHWKFLYKLIDAKTKNTLFTCSAEGVGDTEVDGIRLAITRCLSEF